MRKNIVRLSKLLNYKENLDLSLFLRQQNHKSKIATLLHFCVQSTKQK